MVVGFWLKRIAMINDHLDKTIACLIADAEYLSDFEFKLESFDSKSKEDQDQMTSSAFILIFHIIDLGCLYGHMTIIPQLEDNL